jgi:hypothetical protein
MMSRECQPGAIKSHVASKSLQPKQHGRTRACFFGRSFIANSCPVTSDEIFGADQEYSVKSETVLRGSADRATGVRRYGPYACGFETIIRFGRTSSAGKFHTRQILSQPTLLSLSRDNYDKRRHRATTVTYKNSCIVSTCDIASPQRRPSQFRILWTP